MLIQVQIHTPTHTPASVEAVVATCPLSGYLCRILNMRGLCVFSFSLGATSCVHWYVRPGKNYALKLCFSTIVFEDFTTGEELQFFGSFFFPILLI